MRWFFLLLPWIELFTLIRLGNRIGALAALAYVFVTFAIGLSIIRLQGVEIMARLRSAQGQVVIGQLLADDLAVGLAGLLLLIPGLLTDALALLVLVGPVRRRLGAWFRAPRRAHAARPYKRDASAHRGPAASADRPRETLEGEYRRLADD